MTDQEKADLRLWLNRLLGVLNERRDENRAQIAHVMHRLRELDRP